MDPTTKKVPKDEAAGHLEKAREWMESATLLAGTAECSALVLSIHAVIAAAAQRRYRRG